MVTNRPPRLRRPLPGQPWKSGQTWAGAHCDQTGEGCPHGICCNAAPFVFCTKRSSDFPAVHPLFHFCSDTSSGHSKTEPDSAASRGTKRVFLNPKRVIFPAKLPVFAPSWMFTPGYNPPGRRLSRLAPRPGSPDSRTLVTVPQPDRCLVFALDFSPNNR